MGRATRMMLGKFLGGRPTGVVEAAGFVEGEQAGIDSGCPMGDVRLSRNP